MFKGIKSSFVLFISTLDALRNAIEQHTATVASNTVTVSQNTVTQSLLRARLDSLVADSAYLVNEKKRELIRTGHAG